LLLVYLVQPLVGGLERSEAVVAGPIEVEKAAEAPSRRFGFLGESIRPLVDFGFGCYPVLMTTALRMGGHLSLAAC